MMRTLIFFFIAAIGTFSCESPTQSADTDQEPSDQKEYYQLKVYTFDSELQQSLTDEYLAEAFLPGLKKLGIQNIGVFKKRLSESDSVPQTYVLIPFNRLETFLSLDTALLGDHDYLSKGAGYLNAPHNNPPYKRIESILLSAFRDFPVMKPTSVEGSRKDRIYELRSYESPTESYYLNKVEMFNEGGEVALFDRLGFNAVFYADVISGPKMPNLMYMTTFSNQESRDEHWKSFGDAPEWKELIGNSYYDNNVSHADIFLLYPTEYSDY
ncbi:NIPSNAP family protein [Marinoscillum pacificum]|uniref:NIPSNAP family protein n=1 Tax=Marinoscillum pacificum TaxID=392723 RepID=UPI002157BD51|nr:NIPSNAP family protein [Marinoscillum pacificum]